MAQKTVMKIAPLKAHSIALFLARVGTQTRRREAVSFIGLALFATLLAFTNLATFPRPWMDEGSIMTLARSVAEDGVYAVQSAEGYQTFGAVQSVGPTVVLPIALVFKCFGLGLLQGRLVIGLYLVLAITLYYRLACRLMPTGFALLGTLLCLGSPGGPILWHGRQALGDVPALTFFLAGMICLTNAFETPHYWRFVIAGVLFGGAMVTKSQYIIFIAPTLGLLLLRDLFFQRQGLWRGLALVGVISYSGAFLWTIWQYLYFGPEIFAENSSKLGELARAMIGFSPQMTPGAITYLVSPSTNHFFFFWGAVALPFALYRSRQASRSGIGLTFLSLFTLLWFGYFALFMKLPWFVGSYAPMTFVPFFIGYLWAEFYALWRTLPRATPNGEAIGSQTALRATSIALIIVMLGTTLYPLQQRTREILVADDATRDVRQTAALLEQIVPPDAVIETWERELGIFSRLRYHFPDQIYLAQTQAMATGFAPAKPILGAEYFAHSKATYLVVSFYARHYHLYDLAYVRQHSCLVGVVGQDATSYEIFHLMATVDPQCPPLN